MRVSDARVTQRARADSRSKPASKSPVSRPDKSVSAPKHRREGLLAGRQDLGGRAHFAGAFQAAPCKPRTLPTGSPRPHNPTKPTLGCTLIPARSSRASRPVPGLLSLIDDCSSDQTLQFDENFRFEVPLDSHLAKIREKRDRLLRKRAAEPPEPLLLDTADPPAKLDVDLSCFPNVSKPKRRNPAKARPDGLLRPEYLSWHLQVNNLSESAGCSQLPHQRCAPLSRRKCPGGNAAMPVATTRGSPIQAASTVRQANLSSSFPAHHRPCEKTSPPHVPEPCYKNTLLQIHMNKSNTTNKSHEMTASTAPSAAFDQAAHDSCPLTQKDYRQSSHEEFRYFKLGESTFRKEQKKQLVKCAPKVVPREADQPREYFGLNVVCGSFSSSSRPKHLSKSLVRKVAEKLYIPNIWKES